MSLQEALCPPKRRDISELLRLGVYVQMGSLLYLCLIISF